MKKRTALFKVLKNRLYKFINSFIFIGILWATFFVVGAIIGFNICKVEPIPLTEEEIDYYTSQAEILYNSGISNLDANIVFEFYNDGIISIYSNNEPDEKQKIKITFYNKEIVKVEPYYSTDFMAARIVFSLIFAFVGFFAFIAFAYLIDLIGEKISSIKNEVLAELQENNFDKDENSSKTNTND